MDRASNQKVRSSKATSCRSVCLAMLLLTVQVLSANVPNPKVLAAKGNQAHTAEDFTLQEAENLFRDSLEETRKYAMLVNKLRTEAKVDQIEAQMAKEQVKPTELMAEVFQMMLSQDKINTLMLETSSEQHGSEKASSVQDIRSALQARKHQHVMSMVELERVKASQDKKISYLLKELTGVLGENQETES